MSRADDIRLMKKALALARAVSPRATSPNPRVACLVVSRGAVIAKAAHLKAGHAHAEALALAAAAGRARGATVYCTLEPCAQFPGKKTPSCASALIAAGVRRVVCATLDPNPRVAGRGAALLRQAGVRVDFLAELADDARELNLGFFSRMKRGRPWVVLKAALSLDGRTTSATGRSRWITGAPARAAVHAARAELDAILVGAGTVLADDPALTAHGAGPDPLRVVLAGRRKLPKGAQVFRGPLPALVYRPRGGAGLRAVLRDLARRGVGTVLVEGGAKVHASFLKAGLVDEARVFISPKLISGADDPNTAPRVRAPKLRRVGADWLISGAL
jgi:diaminohydroxyphosphoribosylaminopyrimidine deaminase/5-amino-6-(5-phosphoribosylamino)uracil reductase